MSNQERVGYSSGWSVEEDQDGGFRWSAHGPAGALRGQAATRAEADVDLVVLTSRPDRYLADDGWAAALGDAEVVHTQAWGALTERRLLLEGDLEVEVGITEPAWAATDPVDPGTRRVVTDGLRILHDPDGRLAALADAATAPRTAATDRPGP